MSKSFSNIKLSFQAKKLKKGLRDLNPECCDLQTSALTSIPHRTIYKRYNANLRTVTLMIENANKIKNIIYYIIINVSYQFE